MNQKGKFVRAEEMLLEDLFGRYIVTCKAVHYLLMYTYMIQSIVGIE